MERVEPRLRGVCDRVAVVTGGTRGIGAAVSRELVLRGARRVVAIYREDERAADVLRGSLGSDADRLEVRRVDVTETAAVEQMFADVVRSAERLDILVNCAGAPSDRLLLRTSAEQVRAAIELNLGAAITASRAALAPMLRQRYGRIVNVSSVVASIGNAGQSVYAAAKAGLEGFTRSLAREVGAKGVTVNCVAPGFIATDQTSRLPAELQKRFLETTAVGRAGTPEEVAYAAAFLCAEEAAYVTGTVLQVNGGMYM